MRLHGGDAVAICAALTSRIIESPTVALFRAYGDASPVPYTMPVSADPESRFDHHQTRHQLQRADPEWLFKGIAYTVIEQGVLRSPDVIISPGIQVTVAPSARLGWFTPVPGAALCGVGRAIEVAMHGLQNPLVSAQ